VARTREDRIGRYELLIELGHGGMAELFLARLHAPGGFAKLVAIKRILPHLARDEQFTQMFLEEGRIASRLSHPNVCQVFELDDSDGELFLAMEYLDGVSWDHLHARLADPPALAITAGVLAQAADGLHYAHTLRDIDGQATPVVHRDVSPQNLFVTVDGVCKVLDFGVSKMMTDGPRTKSGVVKGKLPYMAPEQIRGEPVDARTDVFSLGVCLWEALTGERLYDRATDFLIWKAVTEEDAPDVTTKWPACPPAVAAVSRHALARDPDRRFPSARAFADELRAAVPGLASTAAIGDALKAACGDRISARAAQVATAISSRRTSHGTPDPNLADGRRSYERVQSAAETLDSGRSAALTLDDKPRTPAVDDPGATTDLKARNAASTTEPQLRDRSVVVIRDSDPHVAGSLVDPQLAAAARHTRLGLVIGGIAALLVLGIVLVIALSAGGSTSPLDAAAPVVTPPPVIDATSAPAIDADIEPAIDAASTAAIDAATDPAIDASTRHAPKRPRPAASNDLIPAAEVFPGSYSVTSEPYATIYVDGRKLGDTPLFRESVAAGKHVIRAVRADGRAQTFSIEIESGKERNQGKLAW